MIIVADRNLYKYCIEFEIEVDVAVAVAGDGDIEIVVDHAVVVQC